MATSFTTIRLHVFLLLVLLSPALTHASDEPHTSLDSANLFMRLSRRNPPTQGLSYATSPNHTNAVAKTVVSNNQIKPAPQQKPSKKSKKKSKKKPPKKTHHKQNHPKPHANPKPTPKPAPKPAPVAAPIPVPIPKVIPPVVTAPKPASQVSSQPHSVPAQPQSNPESSHPIINIHPVLPTYGQDSPDQGSDIDRWVNGHNKVRRMYTAGDVTWNPKLAVAASQNSKTCYFKHTSHNQYGENIAAGQQSIEQVMKEWVYGPGERESYVRSDPTSHSHYTQVVWADTKEIGCALTTCPQMGGVSLGAGPIKYWVCEYDPPGNVMGWSPKEVHAATGGAPLSGYTRFKHKRRHGFSSKH